MYKLNCKDMGGMDCDHEVEAETKEDAKKKMYEHAMEVHKDKLEGMTDEQKQQADAKMDELLAAQD